MDIRWLSENTAINLDQVVSISREAHIDKSYQYSVYLSNGAFVVLSEVVYKRIFASGPPYVPKNSGPYYVVCGRSAFKCNSYQIAEDRAKQLDKWKDKICGPHRVMSEQEYIATKGLT